MDFLWEGLVTAFRLMLGADRTLFEIVFVSVKVSFLSTVLATLIGIPAAFGLTESDFWGRRAVIHVLNTLMAMPTVVIGLFVYSLLSRRGPFGSWALLYTPWAMVIGQTLLIIPIVTALSHSALQAMDPRIRSTALTLGATRWQSAWMVLTEARYPLLATVIAGFGRVFAEVGISMMLGGNIRGYTRNITTAIALETSKGDFGLGLALGIILLAVAFAINLLFHMIQHSGEG